MPKILRPTTIQQPFPADYTGLPFLTLIEYGGEQLLTVIDVATPTSVSAYVLDLCESEGIDVTLVVSLIASNWDAFQSKPISVLFGALNLAQKMSRVYRTFPMTDVTRIIGRYQQIDVSPSKTVKRRRRREISKSCVTE